MQAPQGLASSATSSGLQHPPLSPLHAPPVYYPSEIRDRELMREKPAPSSFYDPTVDARERERKVSDTASWRNATQNSTPKVSKPTVPAPRPPFANFSLFPQSLYLLIILLCTCHLLYKLNKAY
jgi:DNA helicase INO80